jgi:hypothetical protein
MNNDLKFALPPRVYCAGYASDIGMSSNVMMEHSIQHGWTAGKTKH